nr:short-chain dehydrogenase reductase 3b [Quercus suber]
MFKSSNNKLQGKVVIITGGASGMGEATTHKFADHSTRAIVIVDVQDEKGQNAAVSRCPGLFDLTLPPSRRPGRLGLSDLTLYHLAHCQISLLSLAVIVAVFFRVVVVGCV